MLTFKHFGGVRRGAKQLPVQKNLGTWWRRGEADFAPGRRQRQVQRRRFRAARHGERLCQRQIALGGDAQFVVARLYRQITQRCAAELLPVQLHQGATQGSADALSCHADDAGQLAHHNGEILRLLFAYCQRELFVVIARVAQHHGIVAGQHQRAPAQLQLEAGEEFNTGGNGRDLHGDRPGAEHEPAGHPCDQQKTGDQQMRPAQPQRRALPGRVGRREIDGNDVIREICGVGVAAGCGTVFLVILHELSAC